MTKKGTKITEVNLSAFVYKVFHEDFFPLVGTDLKLSIELSTMCDSRTNLNYMITKGKAIYLESRHP